MFAICVDDSFLHVGSIGTMMGPKCSPRHAFTAMHHLKTNSCTVTDMLSGYYNTQGKVSLLTKNKRDKAHVKIRDKMRKKAHGPSLLQPKFHNSNLSKSTNPPSCDDHAGSYKSVLNRNGYWRTQQERYDNFLHDSYSSSAPGNQDTVQSLVGRVMNRKRQLYPETSNSLLSIRSYKRPTAPYAIQQQSVIKKMVGITPLPPGKQGKGPYVLVLRTKRKDGNSRELKERKTPTAVNPPHEVLSGENNLPALKFGSEKSHELHPLSKSKRSLKSNLQSIPKLTNQTHLNDQEIGNSNLGIIQAKKLLESPFSITTHLMGRPMLQKFPALPSIPTSSNEVSSETRSEDGESEIQHETYDQRDDRCENEKHEEMMPSTNPRTSNSNEILEIMKAKKKAKRGKLSDDDFKTLLKTRNRYTSATKMFKDDLSNMRQLSIISEGSLQSPENKGKVLSAERTNSRNSILKLKSISFLQKIDDSEIVRDEALQE